MFTKKKDVAASEQIQTLQKALDTWKLTEAFFADLGPIKMKPGENIRDTIARCLGITRYAFDETYRYLHSLGVGRVIPRGE